MSSKEIKKQQSNPKIRPKAKADGKTRIVARKDADKAELRELIFQTAREMVLENGFTNLSIRKLAERIGYAPGTIYLYFRDRDDLTRKICVRGFEELSKSMQAATANPGDAAARLAALLHAYADFALKNPETYRLSFMENPAFAAEMLHSKPLETETGAGRKAFAELVKTLLELKENGRLDKAEDENLLAEMLWTAVHGIVSLKLIYPAFPVNSVEVLINKLIETVLAKANKTKIKR